VCQRVLSHCSTADDRVADMNCCVRLSCLCQRMQPHVSLLCCDLLNNQHLQAGRHTNTQTAAVSIGAALPVHRPPTATPHSLRRGLTSAPAAQPVVLAKNSAPNPPASQKTRLLLPHTLGLPTAPPHLWRVVGSCLQHHSCLVLSTWDHHAARHTNAGRRHV
jgi:hypothetical protein